MLVYILFQRFGNQKFYYKKMSYLSYATAEVYVETTTNSFTYKGSLLNGESMTVNIDKYWCKA